MRPSPSVIATARLLQALHGPARGFTLVELMITLVVIAVLAAVAVPAYFQYVKRAAYAEVLAQANPVKQALHTCLSVEQDIRSCNSLALLGVDPPSPTNAFQRLDLNRVDLTLTLVPNDFRGIKSTEVCELRPRLRLPADIEGWDFDPASPCVTEGYVKP